MEPSVLLFEGFQGFEIFSDHNRYIKIRILVDLLENPFFRHTERFRNLMRRSQIAHPIDDAGEFDPRLFEIPHLDDIEPSRAEIVRKPLTKPRRS